MRGRRWRRLWEAVSLYLPVAVMAVLAMGTYWLVRSAPGTAPAPVPVAASHHPDYVLDGFALQTFGADGRLKSEVRGRQARHFPDTDTLEIDAVDITRRDPQGRLTQARAQRAISNGDGSQVQLLGQAQVVRAAHTAADGGPQPQLRFEGEFLHVFLHTERLVSHRPVVLTRGADRLQGDSLDFDNLAGVLQLSGRVRGLLYPQKRP